jgi:hypothetical protein
MDSRERAAGELIRLARDLIAGEKTAGTNKSLWKPLLSQLRFPGWELADEDFWNTPTINRSGLDAVWEKRFDVGSRHPNRYGVSLTVRLHGDFEDSFDVDALMSWHGPGVFGGRSNKRKLYSQKFPNAITGSGRHWQVSPDLVRWVKTTFKKVEKDIMVFVQEDIEQTELR